jgi:DNA-binding transcriptional LysR family regulator
VTPTALTQLRALEAVARHGSFHGAARELYVTTSAVSHHVRRLERALGVALLDRNRNRAVPTVEAIDLVETVTNAYESIASALQRIDDARRAATTVTLTVAPYFSARWLTPRLGRLWHEHPEIDLRLHHAYEPVDFQVDNVDLGVVWGTGRWPSANAVKALDGGLIAVCNPAIPSTAGRSRGSHRVGEVQLALRVRCRALEAVARGGRARQGAGSLVPSDRRLPCVAHGRHRRARSRAVCPIAAR